MLLAAGSGAPRGVSQAELGEWIPPCFCAAGYFTGGWAADRYASAIWLAQLARRRQRAVSRAVSELFVPRFSVLTTFS